jgi:hypothetical protein
MKRKPTIVAKPGPPRFSEATLEKLADDLKAKRIPLDRVTVTDEMVQNHRAIVRNTGLISFHVQYRQADGTRPYLKIGDYPEMSIKRARALAETIRKLVEKGIDPTDGLHKRLIRELEKEGDKWRPTASGR